MDINKYCKLSAEVFKDLKSTRLEPTNTLNSVEEGLQAKIKDPLWLLGRQWQTGEFNAQNGGSPVRTEVSYRSQAIDQIQEGNNFKKFDIKTPLEMLAECEGEGLKKENFGHEKKSITMDSVSTASQKLEFTAKNWDAKRLEYNFQIRSNNVHLKSQEYDGNNLDWYNFMLSAFSSLENEIQSVAAFPTKIDFYGMPKARWWAFEEKNVDIGSISSDTMNYLAMALMEFCLLHSNDWFCIPIRTEVGKIRQIQKFKVFDTFGVATYVNPAIDDPDLDWQMFTLSKSRNINNIPPLGSILYMPNNLPQKALESKPLEEVSLVRDELANLVWAIERTYQKPYVDEDKSNNELVDIIRENKTADREDEEEKPLDYPTHYWDKKEKRLVLAEDIGNAVDDDRYIGPLDKFNLMSYVPDYWIPYQAMKVSTSDVMNEQIVLRRSRTKTDLSDGLQYKGLFIKESKYIEEEEVARGGLLLQRVWQLARDEDKNFYVWRSRKKRHDILRKPSNLRFDYLDKKGGRL
ncbi:MAG: hypothetical protein GF364_01995 [Candidatus Lokiarchaeota archaeon]|nr:hypothetical protein [Candidatus Lokiarchaeota archaeon]